MARYTDGFIEEINRKKVYIECLEDEVELRGQKLVEYFENSQYKDNIDDLLNVIKKNLKEANEEYSEAASKINNL